MQQRTEQWQDQRMQRDMERKWAIEDRDWEAQNTPNQETGMTTSQEEEMRSSADNDKAMGILEDKGVEEMYSFVRRNPRLMRLLAQDNPDLGGYVASILGG